MNSFIASGWRKIFCALILAVGGINLVAADAGNSAAEQLYLVREGVLTVGCEIATVPMEYFGEDGKTPQGFDIDLARRIAAALHLEVEFINTPWAEIFTGLDEGKYDVIISNVTITDERKKNFAFSQPYIVSSQVAVTATASSVRIASLDDLAGYRVAYQEHTTSAQLADSLKARGLKFRGIGEPQLDACFVALRENRVDTVITDSLIAYEYLMLTPFVYEIAWQSAETEKLGIVVKKNNPALLAALDQTLEHFFSDGTFAHLYDEHFKVNLTAPTRQQ